jgi:hypothetical protein
MSVCAPVDIALGFLARSIPSCWRALMKPSSISATKPSTVSTIFPMGPSVEIAGSRIRKYAPFWSSSWTRLRTSRVERPSLSSFTQTGAELLFEIFSQRHERDSTIVTSNLPFEEWTTVFDSQRLTGALLDRLTHHVHILELSGESYRLKQSKARRRRDPRPADEAIAAADPETGEIIIAS